MGSASARRGESSGAVWGRRDARICANRAPITRRSRGFASVTRARWRGVRRQRWLRDARRRLDEPRAEDARPVPRSLAKRLVEAKRRLEEDLAVECRANAEYEAYRAPGMMKDGRRFSGPPKPYQPPDTQAGKNNLTDLDSRNVKTARGWGAALQRPGRRPTSSS